MDQREKSYLELLTKRFDESSYINFIKDLLNLSQFDISNTLEERKDIPKQYKENIDYYKYIAKYNDGINNIGILVVKLNDKTSTNARTSQRNFIATILSKYDLDASLVAFYSDTENNWRLSFVKKELNFTEKGFKVELTPAKRYSYLVGESESVHTAQEFLLKLLKINDRKIKLEDIEQVFDVEKVTKRFFEEYKEKYLQLKEYLDKNEDFKTESKKSDFTSVEFAKKLMGQIVFLYFLQKKGWLGVQLVPDELNLIEFQELYNSSDSVAKNLLNKFYERQEEFYVIDKSKLKMTDSMEDIVNLTNIFSGTSYDKPWGTGKKDFIRSIYRQSTREHKNFFDDYLEPFFYRGLNEKRDNQYFPLFNCKIPFLNGGLFEPINNYRWSSAYFNIPNSMFSNEEKNGILDFLDLYNFTIDEEEPLEKEVAVDPEMLGKIFENLLEVNDRKSKGAFYTPREIVYYMCQESLANYLVDKLNIDYNQTIEFIKYGDLMKQLDWEEYINKGTNFTLGKTIYDNILNIDKALIEVKIADPSVGSGAFPLGMLTEIVKIRDNISTYILIQSNLGLIDINTLYDAEQFKRELFDMKLQTIENCIYAVDIEPSAIDIAKLRLWLSLIVDYPNDEEPRPLPNLDCKIMQGNSLLDEFDGVPLFSEKILSNNLKHYKRKESELNRVNDIHIQQTLQFDENSIDLNVYIEKMLDLQKEYFKTSENNLKKELKEKIDSIQLGMVEETLKTDSKKLSKFREESKKKQKPWFIWKLEYFDVFKNNSGFDIVIGNPPYVDSEKMIKDDKELREKYSKKYKTAKGNWDLFILFIELGFNLCKENGILSFIIPNKLISANYSKAIRTYMNKNKVIEIRDYSNVKVFKEASVYPVTIVCEKTKEQSLVKMSVMENMIDSLWTNTIDTKLFYSTINWDSFFSEKNEFSDLINKINNNSKIREHNIEVKGSATVNEAYITKELLCDSNNDDYFKFINTGTLDPYKVLWGIKPTQYIKGKYSFPTIAPDVLKEKLPNRYNDAKTPKIIIGGMTKKLECVLDELGNIVAGKSTILILNSDINLKYLLGILNSSLMTFYYRIYYNSSSLSGGFYSINTEQIKDLPLKYNEKYLNIIIELVDKLNTNYDENVYKQLDNVIFELYNLTDEERNIINEYIINSNLN